MARRRKTPAKKKSPSGRKKHPNQTLRLFLATAFLVLFVAAALAALVSLRERLLLPVAVVPVYEEPVIEEPPVAGYDYADVFRLIDLHLISDPQGPGWRRLPVAGDVEQREVFGSFPTSSVLTELSEQVELTRSPARLQVDPEAGIIQLFWEERLRLQLLYQVPVKPESGRGRIAIVMDDMGTSLGVLQQVIDLGLSITPSILPVAERAKASAAMLRAAGHEYMIHIPMQPRSYPQTNPGTDALLLTHSEQEIRRWIRHYLKQVPGATGSNNHMGSRYTEEAGPMRIVLEELKRHDLFFIDSLTINSSVAFAEAKRMGVKTAVRDIFLDNREDVDYIREQLRKMVRLAQTRSQVVAICHPYPETLEAIRLEKDWLLQQPVDFVPASRLVRRYSEH